MASTRSRPDGIAYRGSSLPSLHLQAKGSECSFATGRRVPERKSPGERCRVRARNSSSGPCVLNPRIEQKWGLFTTQFWAAAKVIPRWLRGAAKNLSSPPGNNFGWTISAAVSKTSRSGLDPSQAWEAVETIDSFDVLRLVSATQPRSVRGAEAVSSNTSSVKSSICV